MIADRVAVSSRLTSARVLDAIDALRLRVVLESHVLEAERGVDELVFAAVKAEDPQLIRELARLTGRAHAAAGASKVSSSPVFSLKAVAEGELRQLIKASYELEQPQPAAVSRVPREVALRHHVLPVRLEQHHLFVAVARPLDDTVREMLMREAGGLDIITFPMNASELHAKQGEAYRLAQVSATVLPLSTAATRAAEFIERGIRMRAEDVHFESTRTGGRVRVNRGGSYTVLAELNPEEFLSLTGALRGDASMDTGNDLEGIAGTKEFVFDGRRVESRLTTIPTETHAPESRGLQLVVRLHDVDASPKCYRDLGMSKQLARIVRSCFRHRNGVSVIAGPPDSGKNTTAKAMMVDLPLAMMKACTAESPVEMQIDYVQHHLVTTHNSYAKITSKLMQLNTQLLYQAECLDEEGARAIAGVGNYGRKGLTTVHTDSCKTVFRRLERLGISRAEQAELLNVLIAQRIIRVVCRKCSEIVTDSKRIPAFVRARRPDCTTVRVANPAGCEFCDFTGYSQKTAVFEVMVITNEIREAIAAGESAARIEELALARPEFGYRPLLEDALDRVVDQTTTMDEIASIVSLGDDFLEHDDGDDRWWSA